MKVIHTDADDPKALSSQEREWVYNGLDCCVTAEVLDALLPQLDNSTGATYAFSKDLQGPVLEMRLRGVAIDQTRRAEVIDEYYDTLSRLEDQLEKIVGDGCGLYDFNWRSNRDLQTLFYDILAIPPIRRGGRPSVDRTALEKLEAYFPATQIVKHLLLMRDLGKKISMLKTEIDPDGRMRTSYNIAGTTTGRLSSASQNSEPGLIYKISKNLYDLSSLLIQVTSSPTSTQSKAKAESSEPSSGTSSTTDAIWMRAKEGTYTLRLLNSSGQRTWLGRVTLDVIEGSPNNPTIGIMIDGSCVRKLATELTMAVNRAPWLASQKLMLTLSKTSSLDTSEPSPPTSGGTPGSSAS